MECGDFENEIEIGVHCKRGQRYHFVVAGSLIGDGVVPVKRPEAEILFQRQRQNLNGASVLLRQAVGCEIDMILKIRQACTEMGAGLFPAYLAAEAHCALLAEIVVPYEMVRQIFLCQERCLFVVE